jgi:hypothetical protein
MIACRYQVPRRIRAWAWRSDFPNDTEVNLRLRDRNNTEITLVGYVDDLAKLLEEWHDRLLELREDILNETAMVETDNRPGIPGRETPDDSNDNQGTR